MDKPLFTIKFKYFGIRFDWSNDANRRKVLSAVIWYPKSTKRLGYFYPSITF
jgi:hypothetical protein